MCEGFSFTLFAAVGRVCGVLSPATPGSACRSMWCSRPVFIRAGGLSRARRGTDIHGEWRPLFSFCQRAPRLSSPPLPVVCGRQGCGLSGLSPVKAPTHASLWFVGAPVRRVGGLRRSLLARFAPPTVCGSVRPASLRAGGGSADVCRRVTRPSRTGLRARVLLAILAVLLERSRPIFRGARY